MQPDPKLMVMMSAAAALEIAIPILLVLWLRKRLGTKWTVFGLGALAFAVSQILTRLPLVMLAGSAVKDRLQNPLWELGYLVVLAVTAGLFEETARYLCFSRGLKEESNWSNAVSLGAGHGGIESALLVGGLTLMSVIGAVVLFRLDPTQQGVNAEALEKAKETFLKTDWYAPALAVWERICSLGLHIALSVLVLQRFVRGKMSWYWLAVALHAVVNAVAVLLMKKYGPVAAELALTVVLALSVWLIFRFKPKPTVAQPAAA